ncbi:MAG: acetyl-CoA carboxylase, carboxyltransferase subunit beta [Kiritimatiellia bacterium]
MGWFSWRKKEKTQDAPAKEDIWTQCGACKAMLYKEEWQKSWKVCTVCGFHDKLSARERIDLLVDPKSFHEFDTKVSFSDPLKFMDDKGTYAEKAKQACEKTGLKEAVLTGRAKIHGLRTVLAIMDFSFLGGSLGSGTGEKIFRAAEYARKNRMPLIIASASGGARMHEGIISLMQMAKTSAALARLHEAGLPFFSLLTNPTTGGVSASYAMLGDINIAEPGALVGFAGRRVIEQTIKQKLPDEFQTAEYVRDHGFIDLVIPRKDLRETLHKLIQYSMNTKVD